ncbi:MULTISPECIES: AAA family ATPase [Mesorhizobium]|uniref:ATP-dependent DNA helicase n=1 Tax=Mesorhizobium TaxID=68287 RepID=UPI0007A9520C|nr:MULTISPECIES: AAA family ATPase [Mesorhizobium]AMX93753.1 ATP-binding protein [Mesorhizobium ciceri]MDF3208454.1 AAA family ATPase [Mesorhizobium sp. LMG15046]MDF3228975.1 AAA family ATPase [Mesorhizobium sp. DSM 30133]RUU22095.1 ATP-binding protein [Mesorhizobium sp. Primo-B]RUU37995.1 ATP-binding protein [Mesorhizobium sp. Primo-A]
MQFSPQQADAIDAVSAWHKAKEKQVFRVFGYAGTGKTTLARHFAEGLKGRVLYAAYTGKAAMMMRKNGCLNASTIHSTIYAVDVNKTTGATKFILRHKSEFEGVALLVIDECSMVDQDIGQEILSFGIPVLVLGDPAQLPPVSPGAGFFTECDPDVMLTEIHRQAAESPIIQMATIVREGGQLKYGAYGTSEVIKRSYLVQDHVMKADQVLVGLNKTRAGYNQRMREILGRKQALPEKGDRLVCLKNDRNMGLFNGGLWTTLYVAKRRAGHIEDHCVAMDVTSIDFEMTTPVKVKARKECFEGRLNEVNWQELRGTQQFDYGYALTVHKAQGSQWDTVCLFDESRAFADSRSRWLYTGLTRAAEKITVVM